MTGQTQIADQGKPAATGPCAWCRAITSLKLTLEKARYGSAANGARELRKAAREVWCCADHQNSLRLRGDA